METIICGNCDGSGWITRETDRYDRASESHYTYPETSKCPDCNGTGEIEAEEEWPDDDEDTDLDAT